MILFDAEWWVAIVCAIGLVGHLTIGAVAIARQQGRIGRRIS